MYFLHLGSNVKTGDDVAIKLVSGMIILYLFKAINVLYQYAEFKYNLHKHIINGFSNGDKHKTCN